MQLEELAIEIDAEGRVSVQVRGTKGPACLEATKGLEAALGSQVEKRTFTPEYYERAAQADVHRQR